MIIGLVGRSRVGKDTVAAMLVGMEVRRLAQPVKDACKALYGWSDLEVESGMKEERNDRWGITPRVAMVHLTAVMRAFMGADFFTRRFFELIDTDNVVIPDVRHLEDIREIHKRGGITIRITRKGGPVHDFEYGIDSLPTTWTIENDGTVEELREAVMRVCPSAV